MSNADTTGIPQQLATQIRNAQQNTLADCGETLTFGAFGVRYLAKCDLHRVHLVWTMRANRSIDTADVRSACARWDFENAERRRNGQPELQAKPLYRPIAIDVSDAGLTILAGATTYFDNVALQQPVEAWDETTLVGAGLSIVPIASDGAILVGRRSPVVASHAGQFHVVGGHAHPADDFIDRPATLINAVHEELNEELGVGPDEIASLTFRGLTIDLRRAKPEFIVEATLTRRSAELIKRHHDTADASAEFSEVTTLSAALICDENETAPTVSSAWLQNDNFTEAARSALFVHGLLTADADTLARLAAGTIPLPR